MNRILCIIFITLKLLSPNNSGAQSLNFTNYMQAPAIYNPAFLSENNSLQFSLNYRNYQLIDDIDYITSLFSFQTPVNYKWGKLNSGTVGISVFDDRLNNGGLYSYTGLAIAYSQPVQISANSTLSVALQTNCYQKRFNLDQYTTGSQWNDYIGYNSSAPIGEDIVREKIYRFSVNTGIYWRLADQAGDTRAYAGGGLFNINRPDESFTNVTSRQLWRYTMQGGYKIYDEGKIKLIPELLFVEQGQQRFISTGLKTGFSFEGVNPYVPLKAGQICITTRYFNSEAMSFGAILDQPYYSFGLSYDFNVNASIPGNSNAFEAFVIIKLNKHEEKPIKKVSNDYYIGQVREFFENKRDTSKKIGHPATIEKQNQETKKPLSLALRRDFKFAFNDATLNDEAKTYLDDLAALLKENKSMTLEIIGHTDDVGSEEGNRIISIQRAQIVADYLISKGIDKNRLKITGKMDKEPLFPNDSPENRAKNRRVEFIISN